MDSLVRQTSQLLARISFGPFEFDEASCSLRKNGVRIRLQGQPLQILLGLLRNSGRVVSREDFQRELWPESTFVDFEHGLNAAVNRLRQTLGDSADQPRYIETLPGRGYRFLAPTREIAPQALRVMVTPAEEVATAQEQEAVAITVKKQHLAPWLVADY